MKVIVPPKNWYYQKLNNKKCASHSYLRYSLIVGTGRLHRTILTPTTHGTRTSTMAI